MNKKVALACEVCSNRNYSTSKSPSNSRRLEMRKFCSTCKKHTIHKETI